MHKIFIFIFFINKKNTSFIYKSMSYVIFGLGFLWKMKDNDTSMVVKNLLNLMCMNDVKMSLKRVFCVVLPAQTYLFDMIIFHWSNSGCKKS